MERRRVFIRTRITSFFSDVGKNASETQGKMKPHPKATELHPRKTSDRHKKPGDVANAGFHRIMNNETDESLERARRAYAARCRAIPSVIDQRKPRCRIDTAEVIIDTLRGEFAWRCPARAHTRRY
jgi:hypothetical protein